MIKTLFFVGFGGAFGSIFRYLTSCFISKFFKGNFPLGTFIINILGCLLIGLFFGLLIKYKPVQMENLKFLLITGFCGGYTTFSTFAVENFDLINSNNLITAIIYTVLSILFGVIAVFLGLYLLKLI